MGRRTGRRRPEPQSDVPEIAGISPEVSGGVEVEEDEEEENKGSAQGKACGFFACYLLSSLSPRHKGRTYIGFTVNPRRRIRQHNGEIRCGARRTKNGRPWEMVLCVYGFPSNVSALQFEWAWQHPRESLAVRKAASSFKSLSGISNKIKIAYTMLSLPAWENLNLTVNFFSTRHMKHTAGCPKLPKQMKSTVCIMDDLPCYIKGQMFDYNNEEDDKEDNKEDSLPVSSDTNVNLVEGDDPGYWREDDDVRQSTELDSSAESWHCVDELVNHEVRVASHLKKAFNYDLFHWKESDCTRQPVETLKSPERSQSCRDGLSCTGDPFKHLELNDIDSLKQPSTPGSRNIMASPHCLLLSPERDVINLLSPPSCLVGSCKKKHKKSSVYPHIIDLTKSPIIIQL